MVNKDYIRGFADIVVRRDRMDSPFPISEREYRRMLRKFQYERTLAESCAKMRGVDPETSIGYKGQVEAYDYVLDWFHWWEHERGEEDGTP